MPETGSIRASRFIRWREVIELDARMPAADRQKIEAYLSFIEDSRTGQREFARARAAQALAPADADHTDSAFASDKELTLGTLLARRQEKPKIFIATLGPDDGQSSLFEETVVMNHGGGYKGHSLVLLHMDTLEKVKLPKRIAETGEQAMLPGPMVEHIMHELNHAVEHQHMRWTTNSAAPTRGCFEESAIRAANALLDEKLPHVPRRFAYVAVELKEAATLQQLKRDTDALAPIPRQENASGPLPAEHQFIRNIFSDIKDLVTYDAGCRGITEQEAVKKTREILMRAGVRSDVVEFMAGESSPSAAPATPAAAGQSATQGRSH